MFYLFLDCDGVINTKSSWKRPYTIDKDKVNTALTDALELLERNGIKGKDSTPFLLKTICDLTGGESLESNISLVLNNARVGSEIAKEYSKLTKGE